MSKLLAEPLKVVNVGVSSFAESIHAAGGSVLHIDWRPPVGGNIALGRTLARLINHPQVEKANRDVAEGLLD